MKIRYASDLHVDLNTEYFNVKEEDIINKLNLKDIDLLVLAGDTAEYPVNLKFCKKILDIYPNLKIIEIGGNHLYYSCSSLCMPMNETDDLCRAFNKENNRYYYLNNDSIIIDDIKFIGSTMWTKLGERFGRVVKIVRSLNDFRYILNDNLDTIKPQDIVEQFEKSIKFILKEVNNYKGKSIVITHHAPFLDYNTDYYDDISHAFGINLEEEYLHKLKRLPVKWIYGHTHINKDTTLNTKLGSIECVCNQFGYKGESEHGSQFTAWKTYNKNKKIEI